MHRSDCNSPFWKEKFINGLPRLFGEKVKETLYNPLGVIDSDNLTYGDISSTIRSEGMKMCKDFKIQSQANKSKAKYKVETFCTQYGLPPIAPSKRKPNSEGKNPLKSVTEKGQLPDITGKRNIAIPKIRIFIKRENLLDPRPQPGMRSPQKNQENASIVVSKVISAKNVDPRQNPLSTSSSSDHEIHQLNQSSSSEPSKDSDSFSGPRIDLACRDSCCRNKTINVLSKQVSILSKQDKLLGLTKQIEDPTEELIHFNKAKCQFKPKGKTLSQDLDISEVQDGILINPKYPESSSRYSSIIPFKTSQAKNPDLSVSIIPYPVNDFSGPI
ncbi:hypothetical protein SO802_000815 [Lithocarpus litseifolius]|uniref:Uncharacterized protein n=1 Tax=Lithocarpus litseifolius TaxID=425828 RepID=A0AAW2DYB4_9ROSI